MSIKNIPLKEKYEKLLRAMRSIAKFGAYMPSDGLAKEVLEDIGERQ